MAAPTRVFLLDDHEVVRRGVAELVNAEPDLVVVGEAATGSEALVRVPLAEPDVAVIDVRLQEGSGIDVCSQLSGATPPIACLILTSFADDQAMLDAADAGAAGYLLKQIRGNDLLDSIRRVAAGEVLLDTSMIDEAATRSVGVDEGPLAALSPQERHVFDLVGEGLSNKQVGDRMFLAEKTVRNYVSNVLAKLDLDRRTEVAIYAARIDERRRSR